MLKSMRYLKILDRYKLFKDNISIAINEKDIVWDYERNLYKRCENSENIQWIDPTNGLFLLFCFKLIENRTFYCLE